MVGDVPPVLHQAGVDTSLEGGYVLQEVSIQHGAGQTEVRGQGAAGRILVILHVEVKSVAYSPEVGRVVT